jgi:hypothetical protein
MIDPAKVKRGRRVKSTIFRQLLEYLASQKIYSDPGSGISVEDTASGTKVWLTDPGEFPIRITARDGLKYAWNAVKAIDGGGWDDLPRPAGTLAPDRDYAIEAQGITSSTPQVVWARRDRWTQQVYFERDLCT